MTALTKPVQPGIVVAGTLDTKSEEIGFVRDELARHGLSTIVIDCGILGEPTLDATFTRAEIAQAGGTTIEALREGRNREVAIPAMIRGLEETLRRLYAEAKVVGYLGIGGGTNAALASAAFRILPFGLPKMLVSTVAAGDTRPFIDIKDVVLVHSVVDILGLNGFLRDVLRRSCAGLAGMVAESSVRGEAPDAPALVVGLTAFGSTTPAAMRVWGELTKAGLEVLTFHARGIGGRAMETLVREGQIRAVLDLTITEIADELVGGIFSAGPDRLSAAGEAGLPQVILPGSIDMVNFGARATLPEKFAGRRFVSHTPLSTLMRTTAEENAAMACVVAAKLNAARGPVAVLLPTRGYSAYDIAGGPFEDQEADAAFADALTARLAPRIHVERIDAHINDPACADRASRLLLDLLKTAPTERARYG
ncbi:MAG: hypothetical protein JWQ36_48 [Enterovirga sp.]|nr:hypothetical protein [Enterovirga sp.]